MYASKQYLEMYISYHDKKESYKKAYEPTIYHVPGEQQWVKINFEPLDSFTVKK